MIQVLMCWVVYLHVQNDLIDSKVRPLLTSYEMIVGSNITVPLHTVEQLCGQWEDQEMQDDIAHGPLRTIKMPDGGVYSPDESYSLFYNIKQPSRTWDYGRLGSERSVLDDIMFVISEGVSVNPFTPSGYSLLFIMTVAMLFFSIFVSLRKVFHFGAMLSLVKSSRERQMSDWHQKDEGDTYAITGLTTLAKAVGWLVFLCRFSVAVGVLCLGTCS